MVIQGVRKFTLAEIPSVPGWWSPDLLAFLFQCMVLTLVPRVVLGGRKTGEIQICVLHKMMIVLASGQLREEAKKRSDGPKGAVQGRER